MVLICISVIIKEIRQFLMSSLNIWFSPLLFGNCLLLSFTPLSYCFSFSFFIGGHYIFPDISPLSVIYVKNIWSQFVTWLFTFLVISLGEQSEKNFNVWVWLVLFMFCLRNPFFCKIINMFSCIIFGNLYIFASDIKVFSIPGVMLVYGVK